MALCLVSLVSPVCRREGGKSLTSLAESVDIPYKRSVLPNGMTVIIHEDHKTPIVAVHVSYRAGRRDEKPGKSGLAHVYEHLMFEGSEHFRGGYGDFLEKAGARDFGGMTGMDRTEYYETVPVSALDLALWLESDRMGHLPGAVTEESLDKVLDVIKSEYDYRREELDAPRDKLINESCYPDEHPYHRYTKDSLEDLESLTLEDVREWSETYYGAANAVLTLAGDVAADEALAKVKRYFGHIPGGPPLGRHGEWVAKRTDTRRRVVEARTPRAQLTKAWNIPGWGTESSLLLRLASKILASGENSRLARRLIDGDKCAAWVDADVVENEIAGLFIVEIEAGPIGDLRRVEEALDEELELFLRKGPTAAELERAKAEDLASFIYGMESVSGERGKSQILGLSEILGGRPDKYRDHLLTVERAAPRSVRKACRTWLSDGAFVLEVRPFPRYETAAPAADRSRPPAIGPQPEARFPGLERTELANGLKVVLARRDGAPYVAFTLILDSGAAADPPGMPGTSSLVMDLLDRGTASHDRLELAEKLQGLGALFTARSTLDYSQAVMIVPRVHLDAALSLFADIILRPSFSKDEFDRYKSRAAFRVMSEGGMPGQLAWSALPELLYGRGHPYGQVWMGKGIDSTLWTITPDRLKTFHRTWFKPNVSVLVAVGAVGPDELTRLTAKHFGGWKPGDAPVKNITPAAGKRANEVYLLDRPGAETSFILGGALSSPRASRGAIAADAVNAILAGHLMSRIGAKTRADAYAEHGVSSMIISARGQRPHVFYGSVEAEKTGETILLVAREIRDIGGPRPPMVEEVGRWKNETALSLPVLWEDSAAVGDRICEMIAYGYPEDYFDGYPERIKGLTVEQAAEAARALTRPEDMVWVVVGDRARVEPQLAELGFGKVRLLDRFGKPVK